MINWLILTIVYGSVFSPVIPLLFVKRWKDPVLWIILTFILVSFGTDLLALLGMFFVKSNYLLLHIYGFLEAIILFWFYSIVLSNYKRIIYTIAILYSSYYIFDSIYTGFSGFNWISRSIECILIIFMAILLFYQFFEKEENIFIEKLPLFWINIALLTYFSGALFSFILSRVLLNSDGSMWVIHNLSNILKNLLLAVALWKAKSS